MSTRSVDEFVKAMGMTGNIPRLACRACVAGIDERVNAFLSRPIEGDWPYDRIDATDLRGHAAVRPYRVRCRNNTYNGRPP
jgi:transposase-like protein